ncbi:MAG TPA: hypothetical protein VLF91_04105 [Candidatus Saccharimonadales bacterium]|nr:hypothetical protein [Candidatus Saccharimonadales bacterium]
MKKTLAAIGNTCAYLFAVVLVILLSPGIICLLIFFLTPRVYAWLWARLRHDPRRPLEIQDLPNEVWKEADTKDDFLNAFNELGLRLARLADAKQGTLHISESKASSGTQPDQADTIQCTSLRQTLRSKHARITLSLELETFHEKDGELHVYMADVDAYSGTSFPPATVEILEPRLHTKREFMLEAFESVWVVISLLRGDVTFTQPGGQLWAYIPEHQVWIVQYKANKPEYGQRAIFANATARRYSRDTVPTDLSTQRRDA